MAELERIPPRTSQWRESEELPEKNRMSDWRKSFSSIALGFMGTSNIERWHVTMNPILNALLALSIASCSSPSADDQYQEALRFPIIWANPAFSGTKEAIEKLTSRHAHRDEWQSSQMLHASHLIETEEQLKLYLEFVHYPKHLVEFVKSQVREQFHANPHAALYEFNGGMNVFVFFDETGRATHVIKATA